MALRKPMKASDSRCVSRATMPGMGGGVGGGCQSQKKMPRKPHVNSSDGQVDVHQSRLGLYISSDPGAPARLYISDAGGPAGFIYIRDPGLGLYIPGRRRRR
eukprot:scaffold35376_cov56-Isochrysis_galbana.AAC.1